MATNAEMFAFLSNFGPMLGELAARVAFLETRVEQLEGVGAAIAPPGGAQPDVAEEKFEMFGQTFDMKGLMESGMPPGGMAGLMEKLKTWKPPTATATAPPAPAAPAAPAPSGGGTSTT